MELLGLGGTPEDDPIQFPDKAGLSGAGCTGMHPDRFGMPPDPMEPQVLFSACFKHLSSKDY